MQVSKGQVWICKHSALLVLLLVTIMSEKMVYAQVDSSWVEASGKCYSTSVTPEEGWKGALRDAEANAIRNSLGISITAQTFGVTSESVNAKNQSDYLSTFSELNTSTTCGRIISEEILDSTARHREQQPFLSGSHSCSCSQG